MIRLSRIKVVFGLALLISIASGFGQLAQVHRDLDPQRPMGYLESGEVLAAKAASDEEYRLARQVLGMGVVMGERYGELNIAAGCCIALAQIAETESQRRDLWDLALLLDPSRVSTWATHRNANRSRISQDAAADCLRMIRIAEYEEASELLRREDVRAQIRSSASQLGYDPERTIASIRSLAESRRRDSCRGRVFRKEVRDGVSVKEVCTDHSHPIGTADTAETLRMQLSIELASIGGAQQLEDWSGAAVLSLDEPVRTLDSSLLASWYGFDPSRPYRKDGRWSANP
jgi:hypothetical protein